MSAKWPRLHTGVGYALLAAGLFGASTPFAKALVGQVSPLLLAGLLYAGSGVGLSLWALARRWRGGNNGDAPLVARDIPWLAGAVLFGGVLGPALLMFGLQYATAADASLLLNLESVLTAALAWIVFRENVDRRIFLGMVVIVLGGALLSWDTAAGGGVSWGALGIAGACLCWAIDNNLTRAVSGGDPVHVAAIKGAVAGTINTSLALSLGASLPNWGALLGASTVGFVGYGVSLVMFVLALRHLGTARTGAYFSTAPFVGASLSLWLLGESPTTMFWIAGALMAFGVWLHVTEHHAHEHEHEALEHDHRHRHDAHHQHAHAFAWDGSEPHSHPHRHEPMVHAHPHYPDLHHRHRH
ncbi:DMT family transporter [Tahibacter sp.]|uniref:DMT family transporter n=1 Tax=Tahibacter sp. TaxID=2056211 RepID=UPI0028C41190|nr:DMT family transporter [Tahibacter sp.]